MEMIDQNGVVYSKIALDGPRNSEAETSVFQSTKKGQLSPLLAKEGIRNIWELFMRGVSISSDKKCMGTRAKVADGQLGPYEWKTYQEIKENCEKIAAHIVANNLAPEVNTEDAYAKTLRSVGLFSKNREEWYITEKACALINVTIVPIYDTLGTDVTSYILSKTKLKTVYSSVDCALKLIDSYLEQPEKCASLQTIVYFNEQAIPEEIEKLEEANQKSMLKLIAFSDALEQGSALTDKLKDIPAAQLDDVNTICYTSGTSGTPKGVIVTHGTIIQTFFSALLYPLNTPNTELTQNDIYLSYLPAAHIYERIVCCTILAVGGCVGFYCGDTLQIMSDIAALKPTFFVSVPRLYSRIHDKIMLGITKKPWLSQFLFKRALSCKLGHAESPNGHKHMLWDFIVFNKVKQILGGQVRFMLSGSAPLDPDVHKFIRAVFCAPLLQGYGLSETMGGSFAANPDDMSVGHIGGPVPSVDFKLRSIPEMNYNTTSKPPRGELLLNGPSVFPGYFLNPEETREAFDGQWFCTGDIAELMPNGGVKIIDRKKNIFKLSQGEYIVPDKIERVITSLLQVDQVFVYGDSFKSTLVAIVIPNEEAARSWLSQSNKTTKSESFLEICNLTEFSDYIFKLINEACVAASFKGFEMVKKIVCTTEAFTVENGLLTPSFKPKRHVLKQHFKEQIDAMYQQLKA